MKSAKNGCDLKTCLLCKGSLKEWTPAISANKKNFVLKKGELLFREGGIVNGIYFIYKGTMKVHKKWGEDKELIVRFARKGDIVGHRGLSSHNQHYPISATALEDTSVCYMDLPFFNSTLKVNHSFLFELMMFFADELQESEQRMRDMAHMSAKGRVAIALSYLKNKFGINEKGGIEFHLSRQDLASYVGATYETVFKIMNEFAGDGAIALAGKEIRIIDEIKLSRSV